MSKHTAGPWRAVRVIKDSWWVYGDNDGTLVATDLENTDAALIAAAPDLLAACAEVSEWFKHCALLFNDLAVDDGAVHLLALVRAAIAKAEGAQP